MEVLFADASLDRLETDPSFDVGLAREVVKLFRKRMQAIRAATDERAFYAMKSLHFEKLIGKRRGQHSMRLNNQWRLILRLNKKKGAKTVVELVGIEDYH